MAATASPPSSAGLMGQADALQALDMGPAAASQTMTTSIILNLKHRQELANFIQATITPGDKDYHHFLSVAQFAERFAPSNNEVHQLVAYLESYGITVNTIYPDNLDINVTGTTAQLSAAFSTQIHTYVNPKNGRRFNRPAWKFSMPGELANLVLAVPGLNSESGRFHPMHVRLGQGVYAHMTPPPVTWPKSSTATGVPQEYTVGDVANFYQVNPLYQAGINGHRQTVGIMTLANFNVSDVETYWQDIGLKVKANRIKKILVDGGTPVQPGVGDDETSLDVEQSGGLAPQSNIRVYIAPNAGNGFLDMFYAAVNENKADTLSTSWGEPEEFYFAALNGGTDFTDQLVALDQVLMEGAAQGQSISAAAGDAGAYDINRDLPPSDGFSAQLTVDNPADDPYITAAGGTTVATTIPGFTVSPGDVCPNIVIRKEQVWGWDYLAKYWGSCLGLTDSDVFATGGGGGVSSFWRLPYYQSFVPGITRTQPGQSLICDNDFACNTVLGLGVSTFPYTAITLPANFRGRNMPDLSLNADPETGYIVVDCTDFPEPANPGCAAAGYGGTSFVAPQLNGITALIDQAAGSRVGLLNPVVYLEQQIFGYGRYTPFNDITAGDNWFYQGIRGYDNGAGIGTINATNLALTYVFLNSFGFGRH
ncbi:MAG: S53 family peptidase [Gammaproteobacteria bacterium]